MLKYLRKIVPINRGGGQEFPNGGGACFLGNMAGRKFPPKFGPGLFWGSYFPCYTGMHRNSIHIYISYYG